MTERSYRKNVAVLMCSMVCDLYPLTKNFPISNLPIGNKKLIVYQLEQLESVSNLDCTFAIIQALWLFTIEKICELRSTLRRISCQIIHSILIKLNFSKWRAIKQSIFHCKSFYCLHCVEALNQWRMCCCFHLIWSAPLNFPQYCRIMWPKKLMSQCYWRKRKSLEKIKSNSTLTWNL